MKISELIGETTEYDKKRDVEMRKPKSWLKSVSAFANGTGILFRQSNVYGNIIKSEL